MYSNMNDDFNIEDLVGVHSLKPLRPINQFPTVVDDFLPTSLYQQLIDFVFDTHWQYGWRTSNSVDQFIFNANYVKVPKDNTDDIEELITQSVLLETWLIIKKYFNLKTLIRCYANLTTFGVDGYPHTDSKESNHITIIVYIADNWNINFGGSTVLFDNGEIVKSVIPKPNRVFAFNGNQIHAASPLTKLCMKPRMTLMFKATI